MTDYTKLIERLVKLPVNVQDWKAVREIKEGIEALQDDIGSITSANMWLQGEVERLKDINRDALSNLNELCDAKNAEIAALAAELAAVRAVRDQLDKSWHDIARTAQLEAEALQAKLDELQRQEPAAYLFTDIQSGDIEVSLYEDEKPRSQWHRKSLYAAPKALEPLTPQRIQELHEQVMREPIRTSGFFESFARAIEAAHGITKGTP